MCLYIVKVRFYTPTATMLQSKKVPVQSMSTSPLQPLHSRIRHELDEKQEPEPCTERERDSHTHTLAEKELDVHLLAFMQVLMSYNSITRVVWQPRPFNFLMKRGKKSGREALGFLTQFQKRPTDLPRQAV